MDSHGSVTRLVRQLKDDDPRVRALAARLIWQRYFRALLDLARRNLDGRVRRREDEEDILQSMYKSFCLRQQKGEYDLSGRDQLWGLLVQITLCKVRNAANHHRRGRRDVGRELAASPGSESGLSSWAMEQMDTAGPTPAEALELNEALERKLEALDDPELRQVAMRKLEGFTNAEIATEFGCVVRTIERKLERIRSRWTVDEPGQD